MKSNDDLFVKVIAGLILLTLWGVAASFGVVKFLAYWRVANGGPCQ